LVAQDSDHITHLIGPFHGDVRWKIANEWRGYLFKPPASEYWQNLVDAALHTVATIFTNASPFCKGEKRKA
jgi:hypothetical protein